ncbi:MAG: hypothetical protein NW215_10745 [Hyphomicrobiales bacterium]|nr:hypothetical protein [Hyphomicrobiales bacterium]
MKTDARGASLAEKEIAGIELAAILGLSPRRIDQLVVEGAFQKVARGKFALGDAVQSYIAHIKEEAKKRQATTTDDELRAERARKLRLENDQTEAILLPADAVMNTLDEVVAAVRVGFAGLPARVTRDMELRKVIETECDSILTAVAKLLEDRAAVLARGSDAAAAGEDVDG